MTPDEIHEASTKINRLKHINELMSKKHDLSYRAGAQNLDIEILEGAFLLQKQKLEKDLKDLGVEV